MNRDKVTELLKNYRSYKYAVRQFEQTGWAAIGGTGVDAGMPRGGSFGPRAPVKFTADSLQDVMDYNIYKRAVNAIDGALETLNDDERDVITLKWMHDMTLRKIEERKHMGIGYAKQIHRKAFNKLVICLRFESVPEIESIGIAYKEPANL